jgi:hypothetical protein
LFFFSAPSHWIYRSACYSKCGALFVALFLLTLAGARAGDFDALKVAARSYVAAMAATVTLPENSPECAIVSISHAVVKGGALS